MTCLAKIRAMGWAAGGGGGAITIKYHPLLIDNNNLTTPEMTIRRIFEQFSAGVEGPRSTDGNLRELV